MSATGGKKLKIDCDDFRVVEGKKVGLAMSPTTVKPLYKSRKHYRALIEAHIAELTVQQSLLYANNSHSLLLIVQGMDAAGKDSASKHVILDALKGLRVSYPRSGRARQRELRAIRKRLAK